MKKVFFINEPFVKDFCRTQRWAARTRGRVLRAPDWLCYAAAVAEREGWQVRVLDAVALEMSKQGVADLVRKERPDAVVLDSTTPSIHSDIECARMIKQGDPRLLVIMVGPHASSLPERVLADAAGAVDAIAIGEYDYTVRDIIRSFPAIDHLDNGIAYMREGRCVVKPKRHYIERLDELPFPAWQQLDLMRYFDGGKLYPYVDIISGRGCPFQCSFCLWPQVMHGRKYRLRSPQNVVDEMEWVMDIFPRIKQGEFFFEDDTFTVDTKRAMAICEEIRRRRLKVTFSVNSRADTYDDALFAAMKRSGCRELLVGFESGCQRILDNAKKGLKLHQAKRFMQSAKNAGLAVHGCFVIGLPGETAQSAEQTIRFALESGCTTVQFSAAIPFPGTELYDECRQKGYLKTEDYTQWLREGEQSAIVAYEDFSSHDMDYFVDRGLKKFYFRPSYMVRFILDTRSFTDLYRKFRGAKNFLSYLFSKQSS